MPPSSRTDPPVAVAQLLARIAKHFSGNFLLYIAGSQNDGSEKRARTNGAHYYVSKPLSLERFDRIQDH